MPDFDVPELVSIHRYGGTVDVEAMASGGPYHFVEGWAVDILGGEWNWEAWSYDYLVESWQEEGEAIGDLTPLAVPTGERVWLHPGDRYNRVVVDGLVTVEFLDALRTAPAEVQAFVFTPLRSGGQG